MKKTSVWFWVPLTCIMLSGCGYKFTGGGSLPAGVNSVCISMFENRSTETGVENQLVTDLITEFIRNGQVVKDDPATAQGILQGVLKSVSIDRVSSAGDSTTREIRVTALIDVVMKNTDGEEIWGLDNIRQTEIYATDKDSSQNEREYKRIALEELSKGLAENIYERMTEKF